MDNKKNSSTNAHTLKVQSPVIDAFQLARKLLESPIHLMEWSTMEIKDVMFNFSSKVINEKVFLLKSYTD